MNFEKQTGIKKMLINKTLKLGKKLLKKESFIKKIIGLLRIKKVKSFHMVELGLHSFIL